MGSHLEVSQELYDSQARFRGRQASVASLTSNPSGE